VEITSCVAGADLIGGSAAGGVGFAGIPARLSSISSSADCLSALPLLDCQAGMPHLLRTKSLAAISSPH
jgi:hypothetical protein